MSRALKFIRGATMAYIAMGLSLAVGLLLTPITLKYIGKEQYGLWVIYGEILGYLGITDMGITNSVAMMVARSDIKTEIHRINRLISTAIVMQCIFAFILFAGGIAVSFYITDIFEISKNIYSIAIWSFLLAVMVRAIFMPIASVQGILRGLKEQALEHTVAILTLLLSGLCTVFFLYMDFGLFSLPLATLISAVTGFIVYLTKIKKLMPSIDIRIGHFDFSMLKSIFSFSFYLTLFGLSLNIIFQTDNIVIGRYIGLGMVTVYVITGKGYFMIYKIIGMYNNILRPFYAELHAKGENKKLEDIFLSSVKVTSSISLIAAVVYYYLNKEFVALWVGEDNFGGYYLTAVFALLSFNHSIMKATGVPLTGAMKMKEVSYVSMLEAIINLFLSITLAKHIGIVGVALGTLIAALLTSAWFTPYMSCKTIGISLRRYLVDGFLKGILPIIPFCIGLLLLYGKFSFMYQIAIAVVFVLICGYIMYRFIFEKTEKELLLRKVMG